MRATLPRIGLHAFTLKGAPVPRVIELAAQAGFRGVELRLADLEAYPAAGGTPRALARALGEAGLCLIRIAFPLGWQGSEDQDRRERFEGIRRALEWGGASSAETVGGPLAIQRMDARRAAADLRELAALAGAAGLRLSMEFLGFAETWKDLRSAWTLVEQAGTGNVDLLLDTFHLYRGGTELADLRLLPADRVALVHITDAPAVPRETLEDAARLLPGHGGLDIRGMLRAIHAHGYRGWYSLEVLGPAAWDRDPAEVAREGAETLRATLAGALGALHE